MIFCAHFVHTHCRLYNKYFKSTTEKNDNKTLASALTNSLTTAPSSHMQTTHNRKACPSFATEGNGS